MSLASLWDQAIDVVRANLGLAEPVVFLLGFAESIPGLSILVPSTPLFLAIGTAHGAAGGAFWHLWLSGAAGAVAGDCLTYLLGRMMRDDVKRLHYFAIHPAALAAGEAVFARWGALAVFFARFVPPIRAFVPLTAGALGMPPVRFYAVNIPAILLWAPAHVLPGVLAVSALHQYAGLPHHEHVGKHLWMLAVAGGVLIVALAVWTIRRRHGGGVIEPARPAK